MTRRWALRALVGGWVTVGLGVGTVEWLMVHTARGVPWTLGIRSPLTASLLWIPITLGALAVARRQPVLPLTLRSAALHLTLAAATSFALNIAFYVIYFVMDWGVGTFSESMVSALGAGVRFLHLNAGAYLAIVVIGTLLMQRARSVEFDATGETVPATTIAVRTGQETTLVPVEEIDWIEGAGDYARLHVGKRQYLLGERLKRLEARLDPSTFARVHRSAIVNLSRLRRLQHRSHGDYDAVLVDGTEIRVSRTYRAALTRFVEGRRV